mgnify:CR=1 FL=1
MLFLNGEKMIYEVFMPKLTHDMNTGVLVAWLKKESDFVSKGEILFEVETDKAISEVEADNQGFLRRISVDEGQEVQVGEIIAYISTDANETLPPEYKVLSSIADEVEDKAKKSDEQTLKNEGEHLPAPSDRLFISPIALRMVEEAGIDVNQITGSGPRGRIIERDVNKFLSIQTEGKLNLSSNVLNYEEQKMKFANKTMAARMLESAQTIPQFVVDIDVRLDEIFNYRSNWQEKNGKKLSLTVLIIRAVSQILESFPLLNASVIGNETIRVYQDINVGVAFQTEESLLVPVIHNASKKSIMDIVNELDRFKLMAGQGGFQQEDLALGTFTISNLGMFNVKRFTALINPPQTAILAVGSKHDKSERSECGFIFFPVITLSLSSDHRVITGVYASRFLNELRDLIENPKSMF